MLCGIRQTLLENVQKRRVPPLEIGQRRLFFNLDPSVEQPLKPCLRALEAFPVQDSGRRGVCLKDPGGLTEQLIVIFEPMLSALALMDGTRALSQIYSALTRRTAHSLTFRQLQELVAQLDAGYFLDSPRAAARQAELLQIYQEAPFRPAALADNAYPANPGELREMLEGHYEASGGRPAFETTQRVVAALAPHIDLPRGGRLFARTYRQISLDPKVRRFIIFGTGHSLEPGHLLAATAKDFETPLGTLPCDRDFLDRIQKRLDFDLYAGEMAHRAEYSIEFQALYLAHLFTGKREVQIVPILCGSFHDFILARQAPRSDARVEQFVTAVRSALAETGEVATCLIGGVDLSHIGPRYGDSMPVDDRQRKWTREEDLKTLEPVLEGNAAAFFQMVAKDGDRRQICGLSSIYLLLRCMADSGRGRLLAYDQADDPVTASIVSFASIVFPGAE